MGFDSSCNAKTVASDDKTLLEHRDYLTYALLKTPYDAILYLQRAYTYSQLAYPDLAAGDAYRALLLTEGVRNENFEYHREAVKSLQRYNQIPEVLCYGDLPKEFSNSDHQTLAFVASVRCFQILSISLLLCGDLKSAYAYCQRGCSVSPDNADLVNHKKHILNLGRRKFKRDKVDVADLPEWGVVRREIYPWNRHEPRSVSSAHPQSFELRNRAHRKSHLELFGPVESDIVAMDGGCEDKDATAAQCLTLLLSSIAMAEWQMIHPLDLADVQSLRATSSQVAPMPLTYRRAQGPRLYGHFHFVSDTTLSFLSRLFRRMASISTRSLPSLNPGSSTPFTPK